MHRLPLGEELPYRFLAPRLSPFWVGATRGVRRRMLRKDYLVEAVDVAGAEETAARLREGDAVLLAPNHPGGADGFVAMEIAEAVGRPACAMATHQLFVGGWGIRKWLFPRLGFFSVDREGMDLKAFKTAVELLTGEQRLLTIFPEGEVYHRADRLTPLREGAALIALTAARRVGEEGKGRRLWVVPVGVKYRFVEGHDPMPRFLAMMARLESRLTWRTREDQPLVERIYRLGAALASLKEIEYLGAVREGPLVERIERLQTAILKPLEERLLKGRRAGVSPEGSVPERVNQLRRACLERLAEAGIEEAERSLLQRDLDDLYLVAQSYSYPGDYVAQEPTLERLAETLIKLEEDLILGGEAAGPPGPRRVKVRFGEPLEAVAYLAESGGKPRAAAASLTARLSERLQETLDRMGSGRFWSVAEPPIAGNEGARANGRAIRPGG